MPIFLVTFMGWIFWIARSADNLNLGGLFRSHGTQACGLCAKRTFCPLFVLRGSGVQLRWAHKPGGLCSVSLLVGQSEHDCAGRHERSKLVSARRGNQHSRRGRYPEALISNHQSLLTSHPHLPSFPGTPLAPALFKARICRLRKSTHRNKAGL